MGKNNNGLVYCRLINATVFVNHHTAHLTFYTVFVFDPPTQSTINMYIMNSWSYYIGEKMSTVSHVIYIYIMNHDSGS